jgi:NitT/TauT family transport system ATP-binding protein
MHAPRIGYVFQSPRLLNWLTAAGNIEFALEAQKVPNQQWPERVTRQLEMVGLGGQECNYPGARRLRAAYAMCQ